jgi:hypothetical protein
MTDSHPLLRRFERDTLMAIAALAALGWALADDGMWMAGSVLAGGGLTWLSYSTLKGGVDAGFRRKAPRWTLVKIFTRHAILAVAAYVILARLRLHPVGVIAGVSALAVAAGAAAVRSVRPGRSLPAGR